ncbi:AraC family transcriptional regulator [Vallitalea sp.]|jgi:AraC-like DNA-binding protein|uniref:AraC family transcriptional regulator n=1 Tax=Vallitalea sp. TaxID=1882829 RepID=UPI0025F17DE7|nr:AraC family transcriptional regulator [Vallitalea sp.]MCT4687902.1 AraC family transcriptional regulator [Vallitalea sp.]
MKKLADVNVINKKSRSVTFYKFFLVISISIMIPVIMITSLVGKFSNDHLLKQVNLSRENVLNQTRLMVEQKLTDIDALVNQFVSNDSVWKLVTTSEYTYSSSLFMRDAITLFNKNIISHPLIHSIYLFNDTENIVISNSKYSKTEFLDKEILNIKFDSTNYVTKARTIKDRKVFSYVKKFLSFDRKENSYIVVNLNYDSFWDELIADSTDGLFYVIFYDNTMIYSNVLNDNNINTTLFQDITNGSSSNQKLSYNNEQLYVWKSFSSKYNWTFVVAQKLNDLSKPTIVLRKINIISCFVILFIALVLAYFFSDYLYKPIRKLIDKVNQITQIDTINSKNDYQLIDNVIAYLFTENLKLNNDYQYVFPYFKQHSINDIINNNYFDLDNFKQVLDLLDVEFSFTSHYLMLIELENTNMNNKIKDRLDKYFDKPDIKKIISKINEKRILIIMNTNKDINHVYALLTEIHEDFNNDNISLTVSLSDDFNNLEDIHEHYEEVQKQLEYKFFVGNNKILSHMVPQQIEKNIFYDKSIEKELLNYLKKQDEEKAFVALRKLTEGLKGSIKNIDYIKYVYFQVCLNIIEQMTNFGFSMKDIDITNREIFAKINEAKTLNEMYELIYSIIRKCIQLFSKLNIMQNDNIINKVKEYIKNNYNKDLSLEMIADYVYLSPGYLSTLFKTENGITVFDYITNLRMEKAKELLLNNKSMKIQDIAIKLGYNSSQSFIRYFKKYYNVTPNQFRKA